MSQTPLDGPTPLSDHVQPRTEDLPLRTEEEKPQQLPHSDDLQSKAELKSLTYREDETNTDQLRPSGDLQPNAEEQSLKKGEDKLNSHQLPSSGLQPKAEEQSLKKGEENSVTHKEDTTTNHQVSPSDDPQPKAEEQSLKKGEDKLNTVDQLRPSGDLQPNAEEQPLTHKEATTNADQVEPCEHIEPRREEQSLRLDDSLQPRNTPGNLVNNDHNRNNEDLIPEEKASNREIFCPYGILFSVLIVSVGVGIGVATTNTSFLEMGVAPFLEMDGRVFGDPAGDGSLTAVIITHYLQSACKEITEAASQVLLLEASPTGMGSKRDNLEAIHTLRTASEVISISQIEAEVSKLQDTLRSVHLEVDFYDASFKKAALNISSTTLFILEELPIFNQNLQEGQVCQALDHLHNMLEAIKDLLQILSVAEFSVKKMKNSATSFASSTNVLKSMIDFGQVDTSIRIRIQDEQKKRQPEEYTRLMKLRKRFITMQRTLRELDNTFEKSENQLQTVESHLQGTDSSVSIIHTELGNSEDEIRAKEFFVPGVCEVQVIFDEDQLATLKAAGDAAIAKIREVHAKNNPVLQILGKYGFASIKANQRPAVPFQRP